MSCYNSGQCSCSPFMSERSERAQLCSCSIEIPDIYIYVAVRQPLRACPDIIAKKRP